MSGNEEIVGADHLTQFFEVSTYLGVVGSRLVWKLESLDVREERLERRGILRAARRHFNTVEQLRFRDD